MSNEKQVIHHNLVVWLYEIEEAIKDGWSLSQEVEPGHFGHLYEAVLVKNVAPTADTGHGEPPRGVVAFEADVLLPEASNKRGPKPKK